MMITLRLSSSLLALALSSSALADTVRLRGSIRAPLDRAMIVLADVADLSGDEVQRLAQISLLEAPTGEACELSVHQIREAIAAAGGHPGRIDVIGSRVTIRPRAAQPILATGMMTLSPPAGDAVSAESEPEPRNPALAASDLARESTLRGALARSVLQRLCIPGANVRISFQPQDHALLAVPERGRRFEVKPEGSLDGERVTLTVRVWRDQAVEDTHAISASILVRSDVAVAEYRIDRSTTIESTAFRIEGQWLSLRQARQMADPASITGMTTIRAIDAGDPIRRPALEASIAIRLGDRVTVRCLVGGIAIAVPSEAREEGAIGDTIEFTKVGERERFEARVTGAGEAVVDLALTAGPKEARP